MKRLLSILLLTAIGQILSGQMIVEDRLEYDFSHYTGAKIGLDIPESVKVIGIIASSVILEAIGDAQYDNGQKELGKLFQAASLGLIIATPFLLEIDKKKWGWYFASYISMRVALFDPTYNLTRGLPMGYIGNTSYWDKGMRAFSPTEGMKIYGHSIAFIFAISIPLNHF